MVKYWKNFLTGIAMSLLCFAASVPAAPLQLSQVPLYLAGNVPPNIMLMLDNSGSMSNIVPDAPYDASTIFLSNCPPANTVTGGVDPPAFPTSATINIRVISGVPKFRLGTGTTNFSYGIGLTQKCFSPTMRYNAKLNADVDCSGPYCPSGYLDAVYTGDYLNWYFGSAPTPWGGTDRKKPGTQSRLEIAKAAAKNLMDSLNNVRVGLSAYNSTNGGSLREVLGDISTNRTSIKSKIDLLTATGSTPLAETLSDIGRYFTTGYSGSLTLHPGQANQSTDTIANVFSNHSIQNGTIIAPIQNFCQKSFAVLMTDGRPQEDRAITGPLADYDGDCSGANAGNCVPAPHYDRKINRQYESAGSDYLDDIAKGLYEMDLRPDLVDPKGEPKKNNIETYMIGFADEQVKTDPLMQDTATQGGGLFIQAENSAQLSQAFQAAIADISGKVSSAASVALNSGSITSDSYLYQATFDTVNWSGQLLAIPIDIDGKIPLDAKGKPIPDWDAAVLLDAPVTDVRKIVTYKPSAAAGAGSPGIPFRWPANPLYSPGTSALDPSYLPGASELDPAQITALNTNPVTNSLDVVPPRGSERLDFLRGEAVSGFRTRTSRLGDSVYSSPAYVGAPQARYPDNWGPGEPETGGAAYSAFKSSKAGRAPMVYVGANDGMLHGFDADDGSERFAYVPASVFKNLNKLTSPTYNHRFYVDGSPIVGDAFFVGAWHTVLVGGLRGGGQGIYALDITDPPPPTTTYTEADIAAKVLWEFTDADDPTTSTKIEGDADLGYTYSDPNIVRMHNGKWAAVFGSGYNNTEADGATTTSTTGNAVLYIVDIADGSLIAKLDTKEGSAQDPTGSSRPNGLATPAPIDANGDHKVDYIYAGDLFGNLWKFDVTSLDETQWKVAFGPTANPDPMFTACAGTSCTTGPTSNYQPITTRPQVGRHPTQPGGFIVYFGTGKYFESGDASPTGQTNQSFYGIWDKNQTTLAAFDRGKLVDREILEEVVQGFDSNGDGNNDSTYELRVTEKNPDDPIDWSTDLGWYMDLVDPDDNQNHGEKQVTDSILRNGRIIFTTLIPSEDPCDFGGTGWLMELDAETGGPLEDFAPFDLNGDGLFNQDDYVDLDGDGVGDVPPSGKKSGEGIIARPGVGAGTGTDDDKEYKFSSGSTGNIERTVENAGAGYTGRTSWRELKQ